MGHSLRIATNSEAVLAAAAGLWSRFPKVSSAPSVRLRINVGRATRRRVRRAPVLRGQEHLLSIVSDHENFATADLTAGFGLACFSPGVASDSAYLRYHFLEPLGYVLIAARHFALIHAACIALENRAVLLCGDSGVGKTCLAFACARKGWTFLSGDATAVVRGKDDIRVIGRPFEIRFRHSAVRLFPEVAAFPAAIRPNGKTDIEADPRMLGIHSALQGQASHLVFLDRATTSEPASLGSFPLEQARRSLEQAVCFGDEAIRTEQRLTLTRLLSLPILRLRYSDCESAERALRSLLARGS